MYVIDGIAYAGERFSAIQVCEVRPLDDFRFWVRFHTAEAKAFDFKPLLGFPAFAPLAEKSTFDGVYIDHGVTVWKDGEIDIAPETLYKEGVLVGEYPSPY